MNNKCINCKKKQDFNPFTLQHGYGSMYDGEEWLFCSVLCLLIYVIKKVVPKD